jgi:hypothetical protein
LQTSVSAYQRFRLWQAIASYGNVLCPQVLKLALSNFIAKSTLLLFDKLVNTKGIKLSYNK